MPTYEDYRESCVSPYEQAIARYESEVLPVQLREQLLYRRGELRQQREARAISERKYRKAMQKENLRRKKLSLEIQRRLEMAEDRARADRLEIQRKLLKQQTLKS
jgi:hypothetical protein